MEEPSRRAELQLELQQLAKADEDIESGRRRLQRQQATVANLRAGGRNTIEADRLLELTSKTLIEWERHRSLIAQRIVYLEETADK
jgi:hypothetical protein